jgi:hypothetical protein
MNHTTGQNGITTKSQFSEKHVETNLGEVRHHGDRAAAARSQSGPAVEGLGTEIHRKVQPRLRDRGQEVWRRFARSESDLCVWETCNMRWHPARPKNKLLCSHGAMQVTFPVLGMHAKIGVGMPLRRRGGLPQEGP